MDRELSPQIASAWIGRIVRPLDLTDNERDGGWCYPPELLAVSSTNWWSELDDDAKRACTAAQGVRLAELGKDFEASLIRRLVAVANHSSDELANPLLQLAIEECEHSMWFRRAVSEYPEFQMHPSRIYSFLSSHLDRRKAPRGAWIAILNGELLLDKMNRLSIQDDRCTGPFKVLSAVHSADEALHIRTASDLLRRGTRSPLDSVVPVLASVVLFKELFLPAVPSSVVKRYGYPGRVSLNSCPAIRGVAESCFRRIEIVTEDPALRRRMRFAFARIRVGGRRSTDVQQGC